MQLTKPKKKQRFNPKLLENTEISVKYSDGLNEQLASVVASYYIEKDWVKIKGSFELTNNTYIQQAILKTKNEWMTQNILDLMEKRRQSKNQQDRLDYLHFQREIRREIMMAKERWLEQRCIGAEKLQRLGDTFHLHKKINEIAGIYKKSPAPHIRNETN